MLFKAQRAIKPVYLHWLVPEISPAFLYLCAPMESREPIYTELFPMISGLFHGEEDVVANTANMAAVLKERFDFFWVGFYFVKNNELVLGPFQGPIACTRIGFGKGVCGTVWAQKKTIIVPDVHAFPGHIACNPAPNSEIVIPVFKGDEVCMVLDIDSLYPNDFSEIDQQYLEQFVKLLENTLV